MINEIPSGFDLSCSVLFSAKVKRLRPIWFNWLFLVVGVAWVYLIVIQGMISMAIMIGAFLLFYFLKTIFVGNIYAIGTKDYFRIWKKNREVAKIKWNEFAPKIDTKTRLGKGDIKLWFSDYDKYPDIFATHNTLRGKDKKYSDIAFWKGIYLVDVYDPQGIADICRKQIPKKPEICSL